MFCLIIKKELFSATIKNNLNTFFFPTQVFEIVIEEAKNNTDIGFRLLSGGDYVFKTTLYVFPVFTDLTEQDLAIFLSKELDTQVVIDDGLNNGCGFLMVFPSGEIIPCTEEGGDTLDFYFSSVSPNTGSCKTVWFWLAYAGTYVPAVVRLCLVTFII